MKWLQRLFGKGEQTIPDPAKEGKEPYLTQTVVFGMHLYRRAGDDSSVFFVDDDRGIRKLLVNSRGVIQRFPGVVKEDFWMKQVSPGAIRPQIRFRTSFEWQGDGWVMLWQIQPDGRYWGDEGGFGMEHDVEVTLYTHVNRNGDFTGPFRVYRVDRQRYDER